MDNLPHPSMPAAVSREKLLHMLYEAAELEHNLMCTYLYAAFSLRAGVEEGLSALEAEAVAQWRRAILDVAIDEMGHLVAVWNITAALGGAPRFGRGNFPLDAGLLPAGVVVRLAPFSAQVLQHFIFLERPHDSDEPDGAGFTSDFSFSRAALAPRITPMALDYATVGDFYKALGADLQRFVQSVGETAAFCGDPQLQLSPSELTLAGAQAVVCSRTALERFAAIVEQGEGAPNDSRNSHFQRFCAIRAQMQELCAANPHFSAAFPAASNPVLRRPVRAGQRVWIENEEAARLADTANTAYALMLRLLAHAYQVPRTNPEKSLAVDLALGLMRAFTPLAEQVARLPAGPSSPDCHAGVSFVALRDAAALPVGAAARQFFRERLAELAAVAQGLPPGEPGGRVDKACRQLQSLAERAQRGFGATAHAAASAQAAHAGPDAPGISALVPAGASAVAPTPTLIDGVEVIAAQHLDLHYEGRKCIHARFCVTGAPQVFRANVKGPWIHPDAMDAESLVAIAHACPSGAIRYVRKDGRAQESAPPVNLLTVRESGPYAVRAPLVLDGAAAHFRATLCRCGASKNKPYCDGSHHDAGFAASGEPPTTEPAMLAQRDGTLMIDPEPDGPLQLRGNLEILSGTGRVVARVTQARLCRCGASASKPFCDGSHARVGFRSV